MTRPQPTSMAPQGISLAWLALAGVGMGIYLLIAVLSDSEALTAGLARMGLFGVCVILALSLANYVLRFMRWHIFALTYHRKIPVRRHFLYYLAGFAFTISPGKVGEALRSMYLKRHGVPYSESVAMLFSERLMDLISVAFLAFPIFILDSESRVWALVVLATLTVLVVTVSGGRLSAIVRWFGVHAPMRLRRYAEMMLQTCNRSAELLGPRQLLYGLGIGVAAWLAEGVGLTLLSGGLGFEISYVAGVSIYAMAVLMGALLIVAPAGVGGTEVAMTALLVNAGLPLSVAILATILCRVATLWFAVLLGILAVVALQLWPLDVGRNTSA